MQGCPGSPTQAELGEAGAVPIPPSTPNSNGRYANEEKVLDLVCLVLTLDRLVCFREV